MANITLKEFYAGQVEWYKKQVEWDSGHIAWLNSEIKRSRADDRDYKDNYEGHRTKELKESRERYYRIRKRDNAMVAKYTRLLND